MKAEVLDRTQTIMVLPTKGYRELFGNKNAYKAFKRTCDVTISLFSIVALMPMFITIAILIKLESKGKVFFKHTRIGKYGKVIKIYKFRTMVENAEDLIRRFTPEQMK